MAEINVCELKQFQEIKEDYLAIKRLSLELDRFFPNEYLANAGNIYGEKSKTTSKWNYVFANKYDEGNRPIVSDDVGSAFLESMISIDEKVARFLSDKDAFNKHFNKAVDLALSIAEQDLLRDGQA